ncbi:hypothetical protein R1sor_021074 [Riccia sorocarpa]|uniref:Uncharacterized protein n=1 Tax=Riccia sorocarpa TaxID=122646 RepID=A0ABD3GG06_9MARC
MTLNLYLPHPELGSKKKSVALVVVDDDDDSMDDEDFFKKVTTGKVETQRLWEENKKKNTKGKEKVVQTAPLKKSDNSITAPREKLLGSSIHAETALRSREVEKLPKKHPHAHEKIAPTPPPHAAPALVGEDSSYGDDDHSSSDNETSDAEPLSDAPVLYEAH